MITAALVVDINIIIMWRPTLAQQATHSEQLPLSIPACSVPRILMR